MAQEKPGVLPSQTLKKLMMSGFITGIDASFVNPASVDLPISDEAYRIESIFLPKPGETVRSLLPKLGAVQHNIASPLECGVPYLVRVAGQIELPEHVYGYLNPKSSTGRINLFARIVADRVTMYDALTPAGWQGEVWYLLRADSFPVLLAPGKAISQLRLFDGTSFLDPIEIQCAMKQDGLLFHPHGSRYQKKEYQRHADSIFLSLSVHEGVIGWECRGTNRVLEYGRTGHYPPEEFFSPVSASGDSITLHKGGFYILSTEPFVSVPPYLSAELRAVDVRFGEFRSHAAGYIDPGWGWGKTGEVHGRPITLEVVMHEDMLVRRGQNIARIRYERMKEPPEVPYDAAQSNYVHQAAAMLSKHFLKTVS